MKVFVDNEYVGDCDTLHKLDQEGKLDGILGIKAWSHLFFLFTYFLSLSFFYGNWNRTNSIMTASCMYFGSAYDLKNVLSSLYSLPLPHSPTQHTNSTIQQTHTREESTKYCLSDQTNQQHYLRCIHDHCSLTLWVLTFCRQIPKITAAMNGTATRWKKRRSKSLWLCSC